MTMQEDLKHSMECVLAYVYKYKDNKDNEDYPFYFTKSDMITIIAFLEVKLRNINLDRKEDLCVE